MVFFKLNFRREIIYRTSDNIDFSTNWYETIPVQILRAKIFIPIIDEQWYSSYWCSWMLLYALVCSQEKTLFDYFILRISLKEHETRHSLPLIMPVILPSYGERASEVLIEQLTKNYKATVMLSDVRDSKSVYSSSVHQNQIYSCKTFSRH